jgi:hypothetical protein
MPPEPAPPLVAPEAPLYGSLRSFVVDVVRHGALPWTIGIEAAAVTVAASVFAFLGPETQTVIRSHVPGDIMVAALAVALLVAAFLGCFQSAARRERALLAKMAHERFSGQLWALYYEGVAIRDVMWKFQSLDEEDRRAVATQWIDKVFAILERNTDGNRARWWATVVDIPGKDASGEVVPPFKRFADSLNVRLERLREVARDL